MKTGRPSKEPSYSGQGPSKEQAANMRWVLTWKAKDDGSLLGNRTAVLHPLQGNPGSNEFAGRHGDKTKKAPAMVLLTPP